MTVKRIKVLEPEVANKIAAGEVAERPAAIVKELVENSLDAGASAVTVEIREGGIEYIRVSDNGCGIPADDVEKAFLRHATSKLTNAEGLDGIETLGFRGEALASIAAVSHVELRTRTADEDYGTRIVLNGGASDACLPCGCPLGTVIEVSELFYNMPARLKFLKSPRAEAGAVGDYLLRLILANTNVSIKFISNGKPVYHSAGDGSLLNALACVYGADVLEHVMPVHYDDGYVLIDGFCGDEHLSRSTRVQQSVFVNGRYVRSQQLSFAAQRAYNTRVMIGRYPFFALNIKLSPREVDVNVHPNKLSVKFKDEDRICTAASVALRDALAGSEGRHFVSVDNALEQSESLGITAHEATHEPSAASEAFSKAKPAPSQSDLYELFHNSYKHSGGAELQSKPMPMQSEPTAEYHLPEAFRDDGADQAGSVNECKPLSQTLTFNDSGSSGPAPAGYEAADVMTFDFRHKGDEPAYKAEPITFDISPYTVIGVAFDTYIIVEQGDAVFYIDQHAAHERMLYERLTANKLRFDSQLLLTKQIINLTPTEFACIMQNIERFNELGFDIDEFGAASVSVQSVPFGVKTDSVEKLVHDMISIIEKHGALEELDLVRSELIRASCKHAIKAGQEISHEDIAEILNYYAKEGTPRTCPHGRPVMIRVSKRELEKLFKRIV